MNEPADQDHTGRAGLNRRAVLRRGAVLGGAVAWSTPIVQSLASPAFAAGSPLCETRVQDEDCVRVYDDTPDCCACVESHSELPLADALALCATQGLCVETDVAVCGEEEEKPPPPSVNPPPGGEQVGVPTVIPAGS